MSKVRITVLRKVVHQDLLDEYLATSAKERGYAACDAFEEGETFEFDGSRCPEGFCHWAWADIQRDAMMVLFGQGYPWIGRSATAIACCTDGFRPVTFKIERIETN